MTTSESPDTLREELRSLEAQIAELQSNADELRTNLAEDSDKTAAIEAAEQQEALISSLDVRRRDLIPWPAHQQGSAAAMPPPGTVLTRKYRGETAFPWIFNNFHRFAFYATVVQVGFLWFDAILAFDFGGRLGVGLGSVGAGGRWTAARDAAGDAAPLCRRAYS